MDKSREKLIVALDVSTREEALRLCDGLNDFVGAFKIGLQLFSSEGPALVREIASKGHKVFLDLKFHDIPNTVASAAVEASRLGVWMVNVHASGGREMMARTVDAVREDCAKRGAEAPLLIGVTVLTSSDDRNLSEVGVNSSVDTHVERLVRLAMESGMDGVVSSAHEVGKIKSIASDRRFVTVTPGIRPSEATFDDQKRVTTPREAIANGADFIVVGRPITNASDPVKAAVGIVGEIASVVAT